MKVSRFSFAIVSYASAAMLTGPSALAQSEPWWNGAPDAPAQKAPAPQAPSAQTPAPPLPAPPAPQKSSPPAPAPGAPAPQMPPPQGPAPQMPPPAVTGAQPPSQPPPQTEPPQYAAAPQLTGQIASQGEWVYTAQNGWIGCRMGPPRRLSEPSRTPTSTPRRTAGGGSRRHGASVPSTTGRGDGARGGAIAMHLGASAACTTLLAATAEERTEPREGTGATVGVEDTAGVVVTAAAIAEGRRSATRRAWV